MAYKENSNKLSFEQKQKKIAEFISNFKYAREQRREWIKAATEDLEFSLGKQWKEEDIKTLEEAGVKALTINKIAPIIQMLSGIERQNRTDFKAFPKGDEDEIKSEMVTRLLKNVMDEAEGQYKVSEQFEDGTQMGEGWLELYIDYTKDMLNGELQLKKCNPFIMYPDPGSKEYDLSDAEYVIKFSPNLTKNQLLQLFPKMDAEIEKIGDGKIDFDNIKADLEGIVAQHDKFPKNNYSDGNSGSGSNQTYGLARCYDLSEYYYKKYVKVYYVGDRNTGRIEKAKDKKDAENYIWKIAHPIKQTAEPTIEVVTQPVSIPEQGVMPEQETIDVSHLVIIERMEPEIWVCSFVGSGYLLSDEICWSYPKWKSYPWNRFLAYFTNVPVKNKELMIKGVVRDIKPMQIQINKASTQKLRHLNETANSGWLEEEGSWVDPKTIEKLGNTPGFHAIYKKNLANKPQRLYPQPLSAGHQEIELTASADIKEASGFNTDLLAMAEGGQSSGRAIALRQKQGLIMVQRIFDNLSRSKKSLGRFILANLGDLYSVETAIRTIGDSFIKENFMEPVMVVDPVSGQLTIKQSETIPGQPEMQVNESAVNNTILEILQDTAVGKYDIYIGEGINSETTKLANYSVLLEMAQQGVPIPPDVLIEESTIGVSSKNKIKKSMQNMMQAQEPQNNNKGGK